VSQHGKNQSKTIKSSNWVQPSSNHKATGVKLPHPLVLTETQSREGPVRIRSANPKVRVWSPYTDFSISSGDSAFKIPPFVV